jgi:hypothetical protein
MNEYICHICGSVSPTHSAAVAHQYKCAKWDQHRDISARLALNAERSQREASRQARDDLIALERELR